MAFYVDTYLGATMTLTRDQHGAYLMMIFACWKNDGFIRNDPTALAAAARCTAAEWRKMEPVLRGYFEIDADRWTHDRVVKERQRAKRLSEARREAGGKGGRPPKQTESKEKPIGSQEQNLNGLQNETPTRVAPPSPLPLPSEVNSDPGGSAHSDRDPDAEAWSLAAKLLTERAGLAERQARAFFAGLLKRYGLKPHEMLVPLIHAEDAGTPDLQPYLTQAAINIKAGTPRLVHDRNRNDQSSGPRTDRLGRSLAGAMAFLDEAEPVFRGGGGHEG
jgi:uncharacterized protein YdaU (DUF1376 family)